MNMHDRRLPDYSERDGGLVRRLTLRNHIPPEVATELIARAQAIIAVLNQ